MIYKDVINIINRLLWEYCGDYKLTTRFVGILSLLEYRGLPAVQWRHSKYGSWRLLVCKLPIKY